MVYGRDKTSLSQIGKANETTYKADDMCGWIASTTSATHFRDPGYMFDALMVDLVPGTSYFYRVVQLDGLLSDVTVVHRAPKGWDVPTRQRQEHEFLRVFGDLAATTSATDEVVGSCGLTMKLIEADIKGGEHNYVVVMHDGDLSYIKGSTFLWDQFGFLIGRRGVQGCVPREHREP